MPPKRRSQKSQAGSSKQAKQDGQTAVSKEINVPIDEGFKGSPSGGKTKVFVDDDGVPYDANLNQTEIGKNANKFYRLQLIVNGNDYHVHARWGRVGDWGATSNVGPVDFDSALKEYEKRFKSKTGLKWSDRGEEPKKGKYTYLERNYDDSDDEAESGNKDKKEEGNVKKEDDEERPASQLPIQVQRLVELIFNESHFSSVLENIGYNQDKLPLGKLGKNTIKKGFEHLQELASLIKHPSLAQNKYNTSQNDAIEDFSNRYYSTIPHIVGRTRAPLINNNDILQREVAMLDTLTDMEVANTIMKSNDSKAKDKQSVSLIDERFNRLNLEEMTPLEKKSDEYQSLQKYLINTAGHTHNIRYRLQDIFRIERQGEADRFNQSKFASIKDKNRRLLWHGSRTVNYGGILSQGLRIAPPSAPANGWAFGKGIYLADISTKSANYCMSSSSGGHGLLLLCEAELGNPMYELLGGDSAAAEKSAAAGSIATHGVGRTVPQGWIDAGSIHPDLKGVQMPDPSKDPADQKLHPNAYLQYNEYICYNIEQVRLRYVLRFTM